MLSKLFRCTPLASALLVAGCGDSTDSAPRESLDPPVRAISTDDDSGPMTPDRLRKELGVDERAVIATGGGRIRAVDFRGQDVSDLGPLAGLPLVEVYLEQTDVTDLSPLEGMPIEKLYLRETPVRDLSPLKGMPLEQLNLVGTEVSNLEPLSTFDGDILWLRDTPVSDLSPLAGAAMTSLDVQGTRVSDLSAISEIRGLERLNVAETPVSDLTPLKGLALTRLIFTPSRIETGMDVVREMESLTQLDVEFEEEEPMTPAEFWAKYDAGEFAAEEDGESTLRP